MLQRCRRGLQKWTAVSVLGLWLLGSGEGFSQRLPGMNDSPWLGFFSGHQQRDFEFGVDDEGRMWLYLMGNDKERIGSSRAIKIYTEIIVEDPSGKRRSKWLKDDEGFATQQKAGLDHKEVTYTAHTTDDAKIEVTVKYTRKGAILNGRILDKGKLDDSGKIYLSFKVSVPAMYSPSSYSGEDEKSKLRMKKDQVRFVRASDKKRVSLKTYEEVDLATDEHAKEGVLELSVEMDAMEGKKLLFSTEDRKGKLEFQNSKHGTKNMLWRGFKVIWEKEMGDTSLKPFVIEVK